ncbi:MAG: hypothetical protein R8N24_01380 [Alphaproteobacteria bacterium]|nr:hypothetical protein [Alphaproteobacteria bacterium]
MDISYSEENPICQLDAFLPPLDDTILYLHKYLLDLAYHYEHSFYNLALFSFHYIYMTILYIYLLKFHRMKVSIVNSCRQNRAPVEILTPHVYADLKTEKTQIDMFSNIAQEVKDKHHKLVATRDSIAHATGINIDVKSFERHVEEAIGVLGSLRDLSLNNLIRYSGDNFTVSTLDILNETNENEKKAKISNWIKDFYLSLNDWKYLTNKGFIDFGEYYDFLREE